MIIPPQKKRIVIILDTTEGQLGGTEQNTLNFAQALLKRGYDALLIEVGQTILYKSIDSRGINILNIPTTNFRDVTISQWRYILKKTQPTVVVRSKNWIGCVNRNLDLIMFASNTHYLSWEHHPARRPNAVQNNESLLECINPRQIKRRISRNLHERLHLKSIRHTVAVSKAVRDPMVQYYSVPKSSVEIIYPGVDFDFFTHEDLARKQLRAEWNIPQEALVIGSVGRLAQHKGNDFSLNIFAELIRRNKSLDIWCVFAGKGPDLTRLQELAKKLGVIQKVRFPGWQESAPNTFSALDIFLMPSSDEGLGMTLIEAVACGCLSLGTAIGGMTEILSGPLEKYALPPSELDAWVVATENLLLARYSDRKHLHSLAYEDLLQRFDAKKQWDLMVDWLDSKSSIPKYFF